MSYSDDVRMYCKEKIIDPCRRRGEKQVEIRTGDIHAAMGFKNRLPLVFGALGANKFGVLAGVERVSIVGPAAGANAIFTFRIK